jgi:hypothetical protein
VQSRATWPVRLHLKHTSDGQLALEWPNWAHSAHGRALASFVQSCACTWSRAGNSSDYSSSHRFAQLYVDVLPSDTSAQHIFFD